MPKIQSQSGTSLADTYDVEGSIAGVDNLESRDVHLFDEMGGRVFSERLHFFIIELDSGDVTQNTSFNISVGGIPDSPNRIVGAGMLIDVTARVDFVQMSIHDETSPSTEIPFWVWDSAIDAERSIRAQVGGGATATMFWLQSEAVQSPYLIGRTGVSQQIPTIRMRGNTTGFGAGNVVITGLVYLARANPGDPAPGAPSSHGLPLPGW